MKNFEIRLKEMARERVRERNERIDGEIFKNLEERTEAETRAFLLACSLFGEKRNTFREGESRELYLLAKL